MENWKHVSLFENVKMTSKISKGNISTVIYVFCFCSSALYALFRSRTFPVFEMLLERREAWWIIEDKYENYGVYATMSNTRYECVYYHEEEWGPLYRSKLFSVRFWWKILTGIGVICRSSHSEKNHRITSTMNHHLLKMHMWLWNRFESHRFSYCHHSKITLKI